MIDIHIVCDFLIHRLRDDRLTNLKLQKLLYYIQAWYLAINKKPLFENKFQAWVHGPVCREIFDRFKDEKGLYTLFDNEDARHTPEEVNNLMRDDIAEHILEVLNIYAPMTGDQLEELTHRESPWINARKGCKAYEKCEKEILENDMMNYYQPLAN